MRAAGRSSGVFDASRRPLQEARELISLDLAIAEDCGQESRPDRLTCMNRYHGSAPVGMTKKVMAALDPGHLEPGFPQGRDDLSAGDPRKATHVTVIF
jgi:hypothetical protein